MHPIIVRFRINRYIVLVMHLNPEIFRLVTLALMAFRYYVTFDMPFSPAYSYRSGACKAYYLCLNFHSERESMRTTYDLFRYLINCFSPSERQIL